MPRAGAGLRERKEPRQLLEVLHLNLVAHEDVVAGHMVIVETAVVMRLVVKRGPAEAEDARARAAMGPAHGGGAEDNRAGRAGPDEELEVAAGRVREEGRDWRWGLAHPA